jgi:hypothetical protein
MASDSRFQVGVTVAKAQSSKLKVQLPTLHARDQIKDAGKIDSSADCADYADAWDLSA